MRIEVGRGGRVLLRHGDCQPRSLAAAQPPNPPPRPARRELKGTQRCTIEPLNIVDRHHQRALATQCIQQPQGRRHNQPRVGRFIRLYSPQCNGKRAPLYRRQRLSCFVKYVLNDVADRHIGQLRLAFGRHCPKHTKASLLCSRCHLRPESRLPDPRLPLDQERSWASFDPVKETIGESQLISTANQSLASHAPI